MQEERISIQNEENDKIDEDKYHRMLLDAKLEKLKKKDNNNLFSPIYECTENTNYSTVPNKYEITNENLYNSLEKN